MDDFQKMRHQLLQRLTAGEIDREEYAWTLAEIERHRADLVETLNPAHSATVTRTQPAEGIHPGMVLGTHTVKRLLGKGGMGEVWLTTELVRDNDFYSVIKQLRPLTDPGQDTAKLLAIFHKVRLLQHEHICPIYSLGYDGRIGYYFVMKYVEGITLAERISDADRPLPTDGIVNILGAVARALDHAHSRRIIHRDIKPSNVMLNEEWHEVQVVDFGLATMVHSVDSSLNGTPRYMAPEQWAGGVQDGRTDQFALGVVAYELLAGLDSASDPDAEPFGRLIQAADMPPISGASPDVNQVLARSLARSLEDRFPSCGAFIDSLRRSL